MQLKTAFPSATEPNLLYLTLEMLNTGTLDNVGRKRVSHSDDVRGRRSSDKSEFGQMGHGTVDDVLVVTFHWG